MTGAPVILDADGLDALTEQPPPDRLRALLAEAWERKSDVLVPALVCAECCRGAGRTRAVESSLAGHRETRAARPAVRVVPTDFDLARRVGSVLHGVGADTKDIVDAHSVAVASLHGRAVVGADGAVGGQVSVPAATSGEEARMNERTMPGGSGDERSLLDGWLDYYRATLLAKCEGLTGDQLVARSCEPSPMSLIGLVRHMTEMERMYGHRLADWGTGLLYCTDEDEDADFAAVTAAGAAEDLETFSAHCARTGKSWRRANSATPSAKRIRIRCAGSTCI